MAPRNELATETAAVTWLRRVSPWLIVLVIGALLMVPGILVELGERSSGDQHPTLTAKSIPQHR